MSRHLARNPKMGETFFDHFQADLNSPSGVLQSTYFIRIYNLSSRFNSATGGKSQHRTCTHTGQQMLTKQNRQTDLQSWGRGRSSLLWSVGPLQALIWAPTWGLYLCLLKVKISAPRSEKRASCS